MQKVLIIIPAFNEEKNIQKTILNVREHSPDFSIVVIDDGSKDNTAAQARQEGVHVLQLPYNLGIGGAVQTGFKFALDNDFDIALQIDGDCQHDARFVNSLIMPINEGKADMVIGSRFLPPFIGYRSSFIRRIGIHFFAHLISFLSDYKITDPTSGFRAYNRKMIEVFSNYYPIDFPEPEAIAVAGRYDARVIEVPVEMHKRYSGKSSIRYLYTFYYMVKVTFAIVLDKVKPKMND